MSPNDRLTTDLGVTRAASFDVKLLLSGPTEFIRKTSAPSRMPQKGPLESRGRVSWSFRGWRTSRRGWPREEKFLQERVIKGLMRGYLEEGLAQGRNVHAGVGLSKV
jgi:hypothetical protein